MEGTTMRKIDVSEFLPGRKQRPQDPSACRANKGSSYNAFLGFAVIDAAAALLQGFRGFLAGADDRPPHLGRSSPPKVSPEVIAESAPIASVGRKPDCCAFGDLPLAPGSTKVTFRN
jgi:hypothetical protein